MIVPIDDFSPVFAGDTGNPLSILVVNKQDDAVSLSSATITMKMQNVDDPNTIKTCNGTWTIDTVNTGRASYAYQAGDVDTPGNWFLWIKIVKSGKPLHPDDGAGTPKILVVKPLPSGV